MIDRELRCSAYRVAFRDRRRHLAELFPEAQEIFDPSLRACREITAPFELPWAMMW